jgi:hypothetical protein
MLAKKPKTVILLQEGFRLAKKTCKVNFSDAFVPIPFDVESTCLFHLFIFHYYRQRTHQSSLGFDKRPVLSVHLVVEAAGVTEVVAVPIPPPQRGRGCSTVHTLTTLCKQIALQLFNNC